ncbi:MAG: hypothetical protein MUF50_03585 [Planctomycetes bacterium]|jgi:hypothetical protein|nr:hypothetical protein [Planctomycetota bacterium]
MKEFYTKPIIKKEEESFDFEIFENKIIDNPDNLRELSKKLQGVYNHRPDPEDFMGVEKKTMKKEHLLECYTKEEIDSDLKYVENKKAWIEEQNSSKGLREKENIDKMFAYSEMMQAMVIDLINKGWFKNCKAIMTSEYDDYCNGVDSVIKNKTGDFFSASFDLVVFSQDCKRLYEKLNKEWNNTRSGKLVNVKYFEDPDDHKKQSIMAPKFVVGATIKDLELLAKGYLDNDQKSLQQNPLKFFIIDQIEKQIEEVLDFYEKNIDSKNRNFILEKYNSLYNIIKEIKKEAKNEIANDQEARLAVHEYSKTNIYGAVMKTIESCASSQSKKMEAVEA